VLVKMTVLERLHLRWNQIDTDGKEIMQEAWRNAGKNQNHGLYL